MGKLRKGLERNLNVSHLSIEQAPDAILWIDSSGRIHRANRAACQLLGYSQDELLSIDISELHRESEKLWSERWSDLREKGGFPYEDRLLAKGGQSIIAEVSGSFIEFEGEEYLCCFVRDIAGRGCRDEDYRNAVSELEELRERLQREVSYLRQEIRLTHNFGEIISDNDLNWANGWSEKAQLLKRQNMATMEEVEREHITRVLKQTKWRVSGDKGAAKILGMNPHALFSRMKKLGITRPT